MSMAGPDVAPVRPAGATTDGPTSGAPAVGGDGPGDRADGAPRRSWGGDGVAVLLFLLAEAVLLGLIRLWQPRFFYLDDKAAQYLPVWHWLGSQPGVRLPVIDPDQGMAGNFVGDLQYGVLDPFHWALAAVVSHTDGLNLAAWGLHALAATVLGCGLVALARSFGVGPVWSAAAAVGGANSGFMLWFGASWWPAAWGTALLPWLWWGLVGRSRLAVPVAALAAYLVVGSGYPYSLPFAGVLVAGVAAERVFQTRRVAALWERAFLSRLFAAAGGLLLATPGLIAASAMQPYSQRAELDAGPLGSTGDFVPNLLDVLVGGPTSTAQVTGWWGDVMPVAVTATGWFALPLLVMLRWDRLRRLGGPRAVPGLVTAALLAVVAVVATQTPTVVASLRYPFRYTVVLELVLPLLVVLLASRLGLASSWRRLGLAVGMLLLQGVLGVSRTPALFNWHLGAALVGSLVLVGLRYLLNGRDLPGSAAGFDPVTGQRNPAIRRAGLMVGVVVLVAATLAPLASIGSAVGVNRQYVAVRDSKAAEAAAEAGVAPPAPEEVPDNPAVPLYAAEDWPASVEGFRAVSVEPGLNATVVVWGGTGPDRGVPGGVPVGSAALFSGIRPGFGYTSVGQAEWADRWCQDFLGQAANCGDAVARLLDVVPGTDLSWLEMMSKNVLLLDLRAPAEVAESLGDRWREVGERGNYRRFERVQPEQGRINWIGDGVTALQALAVEPDRESYTVSWDGEGSHELVTRIPWWPGYSASLDGQALQVRAVEGVVVAVDLPAGSGSGNLEIRFVPPGRTAGLAAVGAGALLVLAAIGLDVIGRRRRRR